MNIETVNMEVKVDNTLGTRPIKFEIPKSFTWDAMTTISTFIADWLDTFNIFNNGIPQKYIDKADGDEDAAYELYKKDVANLADMFRYIAENSFSNKKLNLTIFAAFEKLSEIYSDLYW